jgi:hypothetical protein
MVRHAATAIALVMSGLLVGLLSLCAPAFALPPGRHYEMVTPAFKGGFGAPKIEAVAPDGESVAYDSAGVFNGAPSWGFSSPAYLARRGVSSWETAPLRPPASLFEQDVRDLSPDLSMVFSMGSVAPNEYTEFVDQLGLWLHPTTLPDTDAGWQEFGQIKVPGEEVFSKEVGLRYVTSSPDFCHVLLTESAKALLQEAEGAYQPLYEYDRGCGGGSASLTLVGVNNQDKLMDRKCEAQAGIIGYSAGEDSEFNAINRNGSEVFFTDCLSGEGGLNPEAPHQLFVRVGGSRTLEVSRPLEAGAFGGCVGEDGVGGEVPCAGAMTRASADFTGASEDGSTVYFTTTAPLTATDKDSGNDLYVATIGCPQGKPGCTAGEREVTSLTQVSHDPNGGAAEVQGVVRVAPDGQRAYFVARGDLLTGAQEQALEGEGRAVPRVGADNLYVYDAAAGGSVSFIADLCSGTERSGTAEDVHCPSGKTDERLWRPGTNGEEPNEGEAQTAGPNGEFMVLSTYAQLTSADTNAARDVYRYDAQTGVISLVSGGEAGYEPGESGGVPGAHIAPGTRGGTVVQQYEMDNRAISEDGSRIVFISARRLSPDVTNGLVNAYEWHAGPGGSGSVSLVSTGTDPEAVEDVVISASGANVFFVTSQGLVPQDADGLDDIYDARFGEGFAAAPAERQPCEGDGCQGPLTNPAPLLVAGSVSQAPGDDFPPPSATVAPKLKPKSKLCKKGVVEKKNRCIKKARAKKASRDRRTKS